MSISGLSATPKLAESEITSLASQAGIAQSVLKQIQDQDQRQAQALIKMIEQSPKPKPNASTGTKIDVMG